jgi:hypothetical protein
MLIIADGKDSGRLVADRIRIHPITDIAHARAGKPSPEIHNPFARNFYKRGLPVAVPLVLISLFVGELSRRPRELTEAQAQVDMMRRVYNEGTVASIVQWNGVQSELLANQEALRNTEKALLQTEDALRATQRLLAPPAAGTPQAESQLAATSRSTAAFVNEHSQTVDAELIRSLVNQLKSARLAISIDQTSYFNIISKYLKVAHLVAELRMRKAFINLELRYEEKQISESTFLAFDSNVEHYLSDQAKSLQQRFFKDSSVEGIGARTIDDEIPQSEELLKDEIGLSNYHLEKQRSELAIAQRLLEQIQSEMLSAERDLVKAQTDLNDFRYITRLSESDMTKGTVH